MNNTPKRPALIGETQKTQTIKQPATMAKKKKKSGWRSLPNDVVVEILKRFSVRSLLRLRCVAKSWNSVISSHEFSKAHLCYLKMHSNIEYRMMLRKTDGEFKHFSLGMWLNEPIVRVVDTTFSFPGCTFVGSCNGLICMAVNDDVRFYSRHHVVLWNPSIQKTRRLPEFGLEKGYKFDRFYGFGYDESNDDYKVVGFYFSNTDKLDVLVKIYSLKTGEFKRIKNHTGRWLVKYCPPTFANGKFHWFEESEEGQDNVYIAYLDLETEEYGKIEKPDFVEVRAVGPRMTALPGGYLYVSYHDNFWLVEPAYGVGETTWNKVIRSPDYNKNEIFKYNRPLFVLDNGEIVLFSGAKIAVLNPNDISARYPRLSGHHQDFHWGIAYAESLVSP